VRRLRFSLAAALPSPWPRGVVAAVAAQPTRSGLGFFLAAIAIAAAAVYVVLRLRGRHDESPADEPQAEEPQAVEPQAVEPQAVEPEQPVPAEPALLADRFGNLLEAIQAAELEFDEAVAAAEEAARGIDRVAPPATPVEDESWTGFGEGDREAPSD